MITSAAATASEMRFEAFVASPHADTCERRQAGLASADSLYERRRPVGAQLRRVLRHTWPTGSHGKMAALVYRDQNRSPRENGQCQWQRRRGHGGSLCPAGGNRVVKKPKDPHVGCGTAFQRLAGDIPLHSKWHRRADGRPARGHGTARAALEDWTDSPALLHSPRACVIGRVQSTKGDDWIFHDAVAILVQARRHRVRRHGGTGANPRWRSLIHVAFTGTPQGQRKGIRQMRNLASNGPPTTGCCPQRPPRCGRRRDRREPKSRPLPIYLTLSVIFAESDASGTESTTSVTRRERLPEGRRVLGRDYESRGPPRFPFGPRNLAYEMKITGKPTHVPKTPAKKRKKNAKRSCLQRFPITGVAVLSAESVKAPRVGLEPRTLPLTVGCSTD